jgi:aspartyl-tRNA(Asn)/glutamyl-tRNA(Gln) amidotransferase subunit B
MEKGEMRVEANVSVGQEGTLGTRVEVKNLNSFRSVERAIDYEVGRQIKLLESGKKVGQETRGWDEIKQKTFSQRVKEESHDYRYFPEPDLPKLYISLIDEFSSSRLKEEIPELPWEKRARYIKDYNIKEEDAFFLTRHIPVSLFFEEAISSFKSDKVLVQKTANYITSDVAGLLQERIDEIPFSPERFASLMVMIRDGEISSRGAKDILALMLTQNEEPSVLARKEGLLQRSDTQELKLVVLRIIKNNPRVAEDYRRGKEASLQYLVGQAMKATKGTANPQVLQRLFKDLL